MKYKFDVFNIFEKWKAQVELRWTGTLNTLEQIMAKSIEKRNLWGFVYQKALFVTSQ